MPIVDNGDQTKMEEGEYFAIETFGSINGNAHVVESILVFLIIRWRMFALHAML